MAQNMTDLGVQIALARELFALDARPPIVAVLCPLKKGLLNRIYKEVTGTRPKKGMLPYDPYWITRSSGNCTHASLFCSVFADISRHTSSRTEAEIFLAAYQQYHSTTILNRDGMQNDTVLLNINRAWSIFRQLKNGEIVTVVCSTCQCRHLIVRDYPKSLIQCPICDVYSDSIGRSRWQSIKPCVDLPR